VRREAEDREAWAGSARDLERRRVAALGPQPLALTPQNWVGGLPRRDHTAVCLRAEDSSKKNSRAGCCTCGNSRSSSGKTLRCTQNNWERKSTF
jgi:hypothetical protein